ncbi:MAG: SBBP repeat-containing protein, partial [Planctomycetota bacterium]
TTQPADPPAPPAEAAGRDQPPPVEEWLELVAWSRQVGSNRSDYIDELATDADGHLYVVGSTDGAFVQPPAGQPDAHLAKFDPEGNELWRRQIGTPAADLLCTVIVGDDEMLYAAGASAGDFLRANQGGHDLFVTQCDLDGNEIWTVSLGEPLSEWPDSIAVDPHGGVFVAARVRQEGPYGPGDGAIIVKLDTNGDEQWRHTLSQYSPLEDVQAAPDGNGGCVVTGGGINGDGVCTAFAVALDGDGAETEHVTQLLGLGREIYNSARDAAGNTYFTGRQAGTPRGTFVVKLGPTGERLWLTDVIIPGVANHDGRARVGTACHNMVVDAAGNVYVTGKADTRADSADTFIAVLDPLGRLRCAWALGPDIPTRAWELTVRPDGVLIVAGETSGPIAGPHHGALDVFLIAYNLLPLTVESSSPIDAPAEQPADEDAD